MANLGGIDDAVFRIDTLPPRPIFVVGSHWSGASLLTLSLGQHPNLAMLPTTNWLAPLASGVAHAFHAQATSNDTRERVPASIDRATFFGSFRETARHLPRSNEFGTHIPTESVWNRWIDGTPANSLAIVPLLQLFPEASVLHVLRDVREVVAELTSGVSHAHLRLATVTMSEEDAVRHWSETVIACARAERAYGFATVHRVLREDLVKQPEATLRRVLEVIGEPFDAACLRPFRPLDRDETPGPAYLPVVNKQAVVPQAVEALSRELLVEGVPQYPRNEAAIAQLQDEFSRDYVNKGQTDGYAGVLDDPGGRGTDRPSVGSLISLGHLRDRVVDSVETLGWRLGINDWLRQRDEDRRE